MEPRINSANIGLNLDSTPSQIKQGQVGYALNAVVAGFDGNNISYQNEQANEECLVFPAGYQVVGRYSMPERNLVVFFLAHPNGGSEIGTASDCVYSKFINDPCLSFSIDHPIKKAVHKNGEIYFTDGKNPMRYVDLDNPPYREIYDTDTCTRTLTSEIDCNKLLIQPNFSIPSIEVIEVDSDGSLVAGVYQFGGQYADSASNPYSGVYSIGNPISIHDSTKITQDFNYPVNKSISLEIKHLDSTGIFDFFNLVVAKTVNGITSFHLVGTYEIKNTPQKIVYTGQKIKDLSENDVFERFPVYSTAQTVFTVQDVLGWGVLSNKERISYQKIFNKVKVGWQTYRLRGEDGYKDPINTAQRRGHMRDEVYPLEAVLEYSDGSLSDRFHIPGREAAPEDLVEISNDDVGASDEKCEPEVISKKKWEVYNTAKKVGSNIPMCEQVIEEGGDGTVNNTVNVKLTTFCSDNNCTEQGQITLKFEFDKPAPTDVVVRLGQIITQPLVGNSRRANGLSLFTLPAGVQLSAYYSDVNAPFIVTVPAGSTTFTTSGAIQLENPSVAPYNWICHSCQSPIDTLYIKAIGGDNNYVFSNTQGVEIVNIPVVQEVNTPTTTYTKMVPCIDECYEGPFEFGEMGYWESTELYPCDEEIWGELAGKPIRHHKFPDHLTTSHFDSDGYIYPIGFKVDLQQIVDLIKASPDISQEEKDRIVGIRFIRGSRENNKSVKAKGIINNVLKYSQNDRIINPASVSGGNTDPLSGTYDAMQNLVRLSEKRFRLFGGGRRDRLDFISRKIDDLRNMELASQEYIDHCKFIITEVDTLIDKSKDDRADEYMSSVRQILETLIDAAQSALDAKEDAEDVIEGEDDSLTQGLFYFPNYLYNDVRPKDPYLENIIFDESAKSRFTLHSPDTSFYSPTLGNVLKLEMGLQGKSAGHIVETKRHAKYQFVSVNAYITSLLSGVAIGFASGQYGVSTKPFDGTAAFTAYRAMLDIIFKVTPKRNPAHQYNSVGRYTRGTPIPNEGNKLRALDIAIYLASGKFEVGDDLEINNYQRESSVYLKTTKPLPFVHENVDIPSDKSKLLFPDSNIHESTISTYYASLKETKVNQWGQIFSYETVDSGFRFPMKLSRAHTTETIFGGDIFINKFSYKSKIPFFIDHRVNPEDSQTWADESDVFYNELSNVGRVKYWFSTDATKSSGVFNNIFGIRPHRFFMQRNRFFDNYGMIFLQAYGIPTFWVESEVNVDMRQAYNDREGDFYPRVSSGIPDDWLQQSRVSIENDNSYNYNKTYSKQNKETFYSFLPLDYANRKREEEKINQYRAIYSDKEDNQPRNNWLIYRPVSYKDFPRTYGKLISIEGIEDRAFLVRFENKSQVYGAMTTLDTNNLQQVYIGNPNLFGTPPLDFAETEIGFNGTQNVFFLKTEFGHVSVDTKRGKVFLLSGNKAKDLTDEESNVSSYFQRHLPFKILKHFPAIDIDNNYKNIGLHGVFNGKRLIITKLDYEPLFTNITYEEGVFRHSGKVVDVRDQNYFCDKSITLSFDFSTARWISFHSYFPNFYISGTKEFHSGLNRTTQSSLWLHDRSITKYNNFYGQINPYILEYPFTFQTNDEVVQSVKDNTRVTKHTSDVSFIVVNNLYFNKAILYNDEQCSGLLRLIAKPEKNLSEYRKYPKFLEDSKEILFTKTDNLYTYNTFWNVVKEQSEPLFLETCSILDKDLNQPNMNYINKAFVKSPLRGKNMRVRHMLDNTDQYRFVSQFIIIQNQIAFK